MLSYQLTYPRAFISNHQTDRPSQIQIIHNFAAHIRTYKPYAPFLKLFNGLCQISDFCNWRVVQCSTGSLGNCRCQSYRTSFWNNHAMGTCQICSTNNCTQIMRILNLIQQNEEWIFTFFGCQCKHILNFCILISSCICNHTLMLSCLGNLFQTLLFHKLEQCIMLSCFSYNGADWTICTAVQYK